MCATFSNRPTSIAPASPPFTGRSGLTLLELLIALMLLSLLATALYTSYFTVARARERAEEGMEERRELGATLDLIRREVASALYNRGDSRLRFVVEDRDWFGKPASNLELTLLAAPRQRQEIRESGIRAVRYEMVEKNGRPLLTRREQDLFYDWQSARPYPQMERISAFLVECHDGTNWVRSWDTALNGSLPRLVRVTVRFEEGGKEVEFAMLSAPRVAGP